MVYLSQAVTHPSTNSARHRVTSLIGWVTHYRYAKPPTVPCSVNCEQENRFQIVFYHYAIIHYQYQSESRSWFVCCYRGEPCYIEAGSNVEAAADSTAHSFVAVSRPGPKSRIPCLPHQRLASCTDWLCIT